MKIDLHIHEKTYSLDSQASLEDIIIEARRKGLDAITITDHDNNDIKEYAKEVSKHENFPIFVGVEYLTQQGDIVAFGIDKVPDIKMDVQDFVDLVNSQGGVCITAHPYRTNNRGLKDKIKVVNGLHAIEAFNGNTDEENNYKAHQVAKRLGIQSVGASDAHKSEEVGKFATLLPYEVKDINELIEAIKSNRCKPLEYRNGNYVIID